MQPLFQLGVFLVGSTTYSLLAILPNLAKQSGGNGWEYESASVVFFAELGKLLLSILFLVQEERRQTKADPVQDPGGIGGALGRVIVAATTSMYVEYPHVRNLFHRRSYAILLPLQGKVSSVEMFNTTALLLVPTFLYAISNNLDIRLTMYMDSVTQQVLLQNKIILTSVLWRLVFGRMLEYRQWFALILLNFGSTVTVLSEFPTSLDELKKVVTVSYAGLMLVLLYCFCSASAGVYCEWVYKRGASTPSSLKNPKNTRSPPAAAVSHSMHFANIGMYVGGLVVNYVGYIYSQVDRTSASQSAFASVVVGGVGGGDRTQAFFAGLAKAFAPVRWSISTRGWNVFTVLDCLNKMLLGLTLGFVMKHLTNIHKLFMFGASMFVSAMLVSGAPLLGLDLRSVWTPTPTSLAGMAAILVSLVLFNWTTIQKTRKEKARKIAEEVEMKQQ